MEKKILIVDDDSFSRKILKNFLAKFPCRTFEAPDGVEALAIIATESPDLVLLDVNMPVLNGLETLQEIRSSATHSRLPVVAVSAHAERSLVMKFIDLGISGFVVKPLRPAVTIKRLEAVFYALEDRPAVEAVPMPPGPSGSARRRLLLVEHDPNFRDFAIPLLEEQFEVVEAASGALAWQTFTERAPQVVLIEESLQLLGADRLAGMIRAAGNDQVRLYLLAEAGADHPPQPHFDGVIRKSFIPDLFMRELTETLFPERSVALMVRTLIRTRLRDELITAAQQSIGVLTSQETAVLAESEVARVPAGVRVCASLVAPDGSATVIVEWSTSERDAEQLASKILGGAVTLADGAGDAVTELVNTIAGRIRASLSAAGFHFEQRAPELLDPELGAPPEPANSRVLAVPFRTADGEQFVISTRVLEGVEAGAVTAA